MYIKFKDYKGQELDKEDSILMSHDEFVNGGNTLRGVPLTITKDGSEPVDNIDSDNLEE